MRRESFDMKSTREASCHPAETVYRPTRNGYSSIQDALESDGFAGVNGYGCAEPAPSSGVNSIAWTMA